MPDARRLYLHIGLQKTGTSYLQAALLNSRESLADAGLDLVPPTKRESYELMVVVRDRYAHRRDDESDRNILDRFTRQLAAAPGSRAVYSQESLAGADSAQVERLLALAGDREVHVVVTVRDLPRGLPSTWQEELKAGSTVRFERHLRRLQRQEREGAARHPWMNLDAPGVLARWAEHLPAEQLHVVTVPPSGSAPTLLLERFAGVLGVDAGLLQPEDHLANTSLGLVQAEVLRRVNAELPEAVHRRYVYSDVVKRSFASGVLGPQDGERILVPAAYREWCEEVTARQVEALRAYDVAGTLDDLACSDRYFAAEPQRPRQRDVAAASVSALATMLAERGTTVAERRTGQIKVGPTTTLGRVKARLRGR